MVDGNGATMVAWLGELVVASFFLSNGAEVLARKYGAQFVGRTLLSVATTLPEIAIVIYAASDGSYATAVAAGLGSNLLMMTLGLALMLLVATTRLSKAPLKGIDITTFKLDKIFLLITSITSAVLFIDGYSLGDGVIFAVLFVAYILVAFRQLRIEKRKTERTHVEKPAKYISRNLDGGAHPESTKKILIALLAFSGGTIGIFLGAEPFIHSLQGFAGDIGVSIVVLAVVISPIAGEMPEKISMIILARKGAAGASIAVANVLGSKILNNTLLLAVAVFGAVYHGGFSTVIAGGSALQFQIILVTGITLAALIPMTKKEIGLRVGVILALMYVFAISIQFVVPQDLKLR